MYLASGFQTMRRILLAELRRGRASKACWRSLLRKMLPSWEAGAVASTQRVISWRQSCKLPGSGDSQAANQAFATKFSHLAADKKSSDQWISIGSELRFSFPLLCEALSFSAAMGAAWLGDAG